MQHLPATLVWAVWTVSPEAQLFCSPRHQKMDGISHVTLTCHFGVGCLGGVSRGMICSPKREKTEGLCVLSAGCWLGWEAGYRTCLLATVFLQHAAWQPVKQPLGLADAHWPTPSSLQCCLTLCSHPIVTLYRRCAVTHL